MAQLEIRDKKGRAGGRVFAIVITAVVAFAGFASQIHAGFGPAIVWALLLGLGIYVTTWIVRWLAQVARRPSGDD
jgi:hypothetical protein